MFDEAENQYGATKDGGDPMAIAFGAVDFASVLRESGYGPEADAVRSRYADQISQMLSTAKRTEFVLSSRLRT